MDPLLQRFRDMEWVYATGDPKALQTLEERIATAGRKRSLITYSELVRGVTFDLPNLQKPRVIDTSDWHELDRAIVGSFLGYISMRSYSRCKSKRCLTRHGRNWLAARSSLGTSSVCMAGSSSRSLVNARIRVVLPCYGITHAMGCVSEPLFGLKAI